MARRYRPSRQACNAWPGRPVLDKRPLRNTFVSSTTRSTGSPDLGNSFGHILLYLFMGEIRQTGADPIQHLEAGLSLSNQAFIHVHRDKGCHGTAGAFHYDLLAPIMNAAHKICKPVSCLSSTYVLCHMKTPFHKYVANLEHFIQFVNYVHSARTFNNLLQGRISFAESRDPGLADEKRPLDRKQGSEISV